MQLPLARTTVTAGPAPRGASARTRITATGFPVPKKHASAKRAFLTRPIVNQVIGSYDAITNSVDACWTYDGITTNPVDACWANDAFTNPVDACWENDAFTNPVDACWENDAFTNPVDACWTYDAITNPVDAFWTNYLVDYKSKNWLM